MILIGIETSTMAGSVALVNEQEVLAEYFLNITTSHAERLLKSIDQILSETETPIEKCEAIAVSIGPGSFTSLRLGVTTAKAMAYALKKPIIGISTLEVLAYNIPFSSYYICPMIDAKKGDVFTALYQWINGGINGTKGELKEVIHEKTIPPLGMIRQLDSFEKIVFLGNGSRVYAGMIQAELGERASFPLFSYHYPLARLVACLGLECLSHQQIDEVKTIVPKYLRLSDAEINRAKGKES